MTTKHKAPKHLTAESSRLFEQTVGAYKIDDEAGRVVLLTACESLDRMRQAQAVIKREGLTIRDRHSIVRTHPAVQVERISRAAIVSAFRALGLEAPQVPK